MALLPIPLIFNVILEFWDDNEFNKLFFAWQNKFNKIIYFIIIAIAQILFEILLSLIWRFLYLSIFEIEWKQFNALLCK